MVKDYHLDNNGIPNLPNIPIDLWISFWSILLLLEKGESHVQGHSKTFSTQKGRR